MKYLHISDDEIQEYLDGNYLDEEHQFQFENHLNSCAKCMSNFKKYKRLYGELNYSPELSVSRKLSANVMRQIFDAENRKKKYIKFLNLFAIAVSIIFSVIIVIYYTDFSNFAGKFDLNVFSLIGKSIQETSNYIPFHNSNPHFLIFTIIIFMLLYFIDKFLLRFKNRV